MVCLCCQLLFRCLASPFGTCSCCLFYKIRSAAIDAIVWRLGRRNRRSQCPARFTSAIWARPRPNTTWRAYSASTDRCGTCGSRGIRRGSPSSSTMTLATPRTLSAAWTAHVAVARGSVWRCLRAGLDAAAAEEEDRLREGDDPGLAVVRATTNAADLAPATGVKLRRRTEFVHTLISTHTDLAHWPRSSPRSGFPIYD